MINRFLNLLFVVDKNQILDLPKLLNEISGLLNPKLLNAILGLLNPKILNEISSLPKLLNEISGLPKLLNILDKVRRAYIKFGPYQPIPPSEAPISPQFIDKNRREFLPSWYKLFLDSLEFSPSNLSGNSFSRPTHLRQVQDAFTEENGIYNPILNWALINFVKYENEVAESVWAPLLLS
ncbi:hypothetical protein PVK06_002743 [Gossypium arboreum]|uniref:Uncharacterized protein n=1 Tax=Gossypium arboreum TaxID=29729 RepID=A0ABR0R5I6_GOSAR|nr:hypothetical protein PVK06_002743 [Gossypium arboreum]